MGLDLISSAVISKGGLYRYELRRIWNNELGLCNFIMLNPSTADAVQDDSTIRRCTGFAKSFGCDGLVVTNLFGLRSRSPVFLGIESDPVGPENDEYVLRVAKECGMVICAWGSSVEINGRDKEIGRLLDSNGIKYSCLRVSQSGNPCHPLYLKSDLKPIPFKVKS